MQSLELAEFLSQLFSAHEVETDRQGEWVLLADGRHRVRAAVTDLSQSPAGSWVRLDVQMELAPGKHLIESFAGLGADLAEAVADAQRNFALNSLHVILATFYAKGLDQVQREVWLLGGEPKEVVIGGVAVRGEIPTEVPGTPQWFDAFAEAIRAQRLSPGIHWVRLYFAMMEPGQTICEVLLDNEPWPPLQATMAAYPWPKSGQFYSVRQFLTIRGGLDLGDVVAACCRLKESSDAEICAELRSRGEDPVEVEKSVALVPLAFGRAVVEALRVRVCDYALVPDPNSKGSAEIVLLDEPIYAAALAYGKDARAKGLMTREQFLAVAGRSAEMTMLNQALFAGSKPENLVLGPPMLFLSPEARTQFAAKARRPRRRWWQFWK